MAKKKKSNKSFQNKWIATIAILLILFIVYLAVKPSYVKAPTHDTASTFEKNSDWKTYSSEVTGDWKSYEGNTQGHGTPFTIKYPPDCQFKDNSIFVENAKSIISCTDFEIHPKPQNNFGAVDLISDKFIILGINTGWQKQTYKNIYFHETLYGLDNNDNTHQINVYYSNESKDALQKAEQIISTFDILSGSLEQNKIIDDITKKYPSDKFELPAETFVYLPWHKAIKGVIISKSEGAARFIATDVTGEWNIAWIGQGIPSCSILAKQNIPPQNHEPKYDPLICESD